MTAEAIVCIQPLAYVLIHEHWASVRMCFDCCLGRFTHWLLRYPSAILICPETFVMYSGNREMYEF